MNAAPNPDPAPAVNDPALPAPAPASNPDRTPPDTPPPSPGEPVRNRFEFDGARAALAGIMITNGLLTLATLGTYRFWGKVRVRRYLWSRVSFLGDRAEYTGTGRELLFGFVPALLVLALLAGATFWIELAFRDSFQGGFAAESAYFLAVVFFSYLAGYRARRYRLSRTEWRGIRFAQDGSSLRYALLGLGWLLVLIASLGAVYAVYRTRLQRYRTAHTSFGNRRFTFEGRAADLWKPWLLAWLFFLPTLGLTYVWYRAREFRYFAAKTRCGALSFRSRLAARSLVLNVIVYLLSSLVLLALLATILGIAAMSHPALPTELRPHSPGRPLTEMGAGDVLVYAVTFAIVFPVVGALRVMFLVHPVFREVAGSTAVIGDEDYGAIAQSRQSSPRRGEGLADALDVGAV